MPASCLGSQLGSGGPRSPYLCGVHIGYPLWLSCELAFTLPHPFWTCACSAIRTAAAIERPLLAAFLIISPSVALVLAKSLQSDDQNSYFCFIRRPDRPPGQHGSSGQAHSQPAEAAATQATWVWNSSHWGSLGGSTGAALRFAGGNEAQGVRVCAVFLCMPVPHAACMAMRVLAWVDACMHACRRALAARSHAHAMLTRVQAFARACVAIVCAGVPLRANILSLHGLVPVRNDGVRVCGWWINILTSIWAHLVC